MAHLSCCKHCGKELPPNEGRGRTRLFCDAACGMAYRREAMSQRVEETFLAAPYVLPSYPLLHHERFQPYGPVYADSIDVIITDPPYGRDTLDIYQDLATFGLKTLHEGGWLLCLTGWGLDWEIRKIFTEAGLEFITVCTYLIPGATLTADRWTSTGKRSFQQQAKPLLWYQKRGTRLDRRRAGTSDLIQTKVTGKKDLDREAFHWQQSVEAFKQIVWIYTNPQDVICDPCMGSGTTLVAARAMNRRRVIGIEEDGEAYQQAKARVDALEDEGVVAAV